MEIYKVTLFGHRDLSEHQKVEERLYPILKNLIQTKPYVEIYIGRNGEFDIFVASVVKRVQNDLGNHNSCMTLVLPYSDKDIEYYYQYYDSVIIPECVEGTHPKGAITKRNRWMAEECDLFICYVTHENGGAYTALKYANKLGKDIINLGADY